MASAKPGPVQIRHTQLDAEGLRSRVAVNKESIQYIVITRVISYVEKVETWTAKQATQNIATRPLAPMWNKHHGRRPHVRLRPLL